MSDDVLTGYSEDDAVAWLTEAEDDAVAWLTEGDAAAAPRAAPTEADVAALRVGVLRVTADVGVHRAGLGQ